MKSSSLLLTGLTAVAHLAWAQSVEFFYTHTVDLCEIDGTSMQANEQTTHGGVCAYRADTERVYGCPAPDTTCWTWYETCATNAGTAQITCNRGGSIWCCNNVAGETCTTTEGQINVCISNFTSPNSGVSISKANQKYLQALDVSNVTATSQSTDPTPFSTRQLNAATSTSTSSSSSISTASGSASSITASNSASATAAGSSSTSGSSASSASSSSGSSRISGGAIAGIVIGAILVVALVAGAFFVLGRRRKAKSQTPAWSNETPVNTMESTTHSNSNEKHRYGDYQYGPAPASELGNSGTSRTEMPTTTSTRTADGRYEMP